MEISTDRTMILAGGASKHGNGVLVGLSFDRHFDYICKEEFENKPIGCLRKLKQSDIYLVGAGNTLNIVHYENKHFSTLRTFSSIYQNQMVSDISVHQNEIVLLGGNGDKVVHLNFKNNVGEFKVE